MASGYGTDDGETIEATVHFRDTGTGIYKGHANFGAATRIDLFALAAGGAYVTTATTSSTVPFTWANTDIIVVAGTYEAV